MRTLLALIAAAIVFLCGWHTSAHGTVRIADDRGGRIGTYVDKYSQLYKSHEPVVIDGMCASACTMVLILPKSQICATPRAWLGFHQAWDVGSARLNNGQVVPNMVANNDATEYIFQYYPGPVHTWINMHHGMPPPWRLLKLWGRELAKFVPPCRQAGTLPPIH